MRLPAGQGERRLIRSAQSSVGVRLDQGAAGDGGLLLSVIIW